MEDQSVLRWVNRIRQERGKPTLAELPAGKQGSSCECPLARALTFDDATAHVSKFGVRWDGGGEIAYMPLPTGIQAFVADFDAGRHGELVQA